jgi:hypothetical protein
MCRTEKKRGCDAKRLNCLAREQKIRKAALTFGRAVFLFLFSATVLIDFYITVSYNMLIGQVVDLPEGKARCGVQPRRIVM